MSGRRAIVIGGGAIGTACAYYLAKADWQVTLIDKDRQGAGCTGGNCGLMAYSHVLPLNVPGAVTKTLKALCRRNSPLYVKPRLDPPLWWWLMRFAAHCNEKAMLESARARAALIDSSASLYRRLLEDEAIECEWEQSGALFVYQTQEEMDHYAETDRRLCEQFDLPATRYDGQALIELEPAIRPDAAAGGWHYQQDAHLHPEKLLSSWRRVIERLGGTIQEQCEARGFLRQRGAATAVETSQGDMPADAFVVATGAWTPLLSRQLGCRVPIQPGKGYTITTPRPAACPKIPILFQEHKVVVTPLRSAYRLGSTMEFSGYDPSLNPRRTRLLTDGAAEYLHEPCAEPIEDRWYGWRPMTFDGKPIIDRSPAMQNVFVAAGHNMLGLTLATATGKLVMELVTGRLPHLASAPYALTRF